MFADFEISCVDFVFALAFEVISCLISQMFSGEIKMSEVFDLNVYLILDSFE